MSKRTWDEIYAETERDHQKHEEGLKFYNWRDCLEVTSCDYDCKNCEDLREAEYKKFQEAEIAFEKKWGVHWFTGKPSRRNPNQRRG